MNEGMRIQKLEEIMREPPYMTGIRINYKGENQVFNAYKIPLTFLIYNKYNGRIGTQVKSFEKQKYVLNPEDKGDKKIIEDFLWFSKEDRNEKTMQSLISDHQQRYGIVSRNGVIIDGNRRASLLNRIFSKREEYHKKNTPVLHCAYFIAIILPDDAGKREILELETRYQIGVDEKLDYNAIEKYLKCKDLIDVGYNEKDIARMMDEKPAEIKKWLSMLELMNKYLDQYGYNGIYTRLDKREGQFVDLYRYLDNYREGKVHTDWAYEDSDISDLELVSFDYIRAQYEGKDFRNIGNTDKKKIGSIFSSEKLWDEFCDNHFNVVEDIEEKSVDDLREENLNEDLSKILESRDNDWQVKVKDKFKGNLGRMVRKLEDIQESSQPYLLLQKAKSTLESIDTDVLSFYDDEVYNLIKDINGLMWEFKKKIEKRRKQ